MSTAAQAMPQTAAQDTWSAFYWAVRRELWEYRSVYMVPMAVAAVYLFAFLVSTIGGVWNRGLTVDVTNPTLHSAKLAEPFGLASGLVMGVTFIIGLYYSLDALHAERRDRSILFWKSLPVSDGLTVLAKASIPMVLLPLLGFALTFALQLVMFVISSISVALHGNDLLTLWHQLPWAQMTLALFMHLIFGHGLWYAPIYAFLLLVSAWAKRAPLLWVAVPALAIGFGEKVAFNTTHFWQMLGNRLAGSGSSPFELMPTEHGGHMMMNIRFVDFWLQPGLWTGLAVAALCLWAATRLRQVRGPN